MGHTNRTVLTALQKKPGAQMQCQQITRNKQPPIADIAHTESNGQK